jgi:hypothetical protein
VWTFDAALCLWAILQFTTQPLSHGPTTTTISWTESSQIELWIKNGGGVSIQGLGNVAQLSVAVLLQTFADRLEIMSWGLAARYRKVLINLLRDET